ncbi:MAG: aspartate/glutamate racemase family protein [Betaproteobacteria bacterium]|nr:aspartate/glutamate racemase family protein [Betaproteobacteria bacterium]
MPTVASVHCPHIVGILGGMGPAAGADFLRHFVHACAVRLQELGMAVNDQAFPEHWLAQVPVPDRTHALLATGPERNAPLEPMARAIGQLETLGVRAVAIACNTAHAWHAELQAGFPGIELLHAPREVAARLKAAGRREAALMATQGTYLTGLYETALAEAGIACHLPTEEERAQLMRGIYQGVKADDIDGARMCFVEVGRSLIERHGDVALIMGCTEIPLPLVSAPQARAWTLVNSTDVLACALADRAYANIAGESP